tara:strand:- start:41 stop:541 length:501 start_codon:yes stop_codon:yes gene_type:complete
MTKHNHITYNIKLAARIVQWMDFLHKTDDFKLDDFFHGIYAGQEELADSYIEEKRAYLRKHGVWAWMHKLDNRNITRFYSLIMKTDPMNWWMDYSKENRKAMQSMIEDAVEQVSERIGREVDTLLKGSPTPEDLGAEPRETFDEHPEDMPNDSSTMPNDRNDHKQE